MLSFLAFKNYLNRNKLQFPYRFHVGQRLGLSYRSDYECNEVRYMQTSRLSFVMYEYCEIATFSLVFWVRCGT